MVDAVNEDLGRLFAGQGDIRMYGIATVAAGKTGTAQLGGERSAALVVHRLRAGQDGATPAIAIAVLVERRVGVGPRRADRGPGDGGYLRLSGVTRHIPRPAGVWAA